MASKNSVYKLPERIRTLPERSRTLPERSRRQMCRFVVIIIAYTFFSCSQKTFDSKEELMAFVTDTENGYTQEKTINGIEYGITYRPTDVLVEQTLTENWSQIEVDSLRKKYNEYLYFNLSLSNNNKEILNGLAGNRNEFGAMVNQLAFGMENKVHLFSKTKDTIPLADYIYPRLYGMGGATSLLFVYPRDKKMMNEDFFHFTIEDIGLVTGEVGFKIPTEIIKNEPKIKFE